VFTAHKPFDARFARDARAHFFNHQVSSSVSATVRARDYLEANRVKKLACEKLELISRRSTRSRRNFFEI
jgi:hypothetical protein